MITLAKIYLPLRLEECAQKVGEGFSKTRVGNQKTALGVMFFRTSNFLNWRILLLDYEIGQYVLYHELAHLKHMNHSTKYWDLLSRWVGDARGLDRNCLCRAVNLCSWQGTRHSIGRNSAKFPASSSSKRLHERHRFAFIFSHTSTGVTPSFP